MKYLSVCSGIEAATVAWHPLGWEPVAFCEIESFPSAVLAHHYPNVPNLGDMTGVAALVRSGAVAAPDILVGGTPCQAFSFAGLRQSLDDARGQLSLSFVDLANAIDTMRTVPAIIVWENVPGVLSTKDNAFGCFLGALAGEDDPLLPPGKKNGGFERWPNAGCVYGPRRTIAWRVLDAQYVGVAQRRRRVFVVASARDGFDPAAVLFEFDGVRRDTAPRRESRQDITHDIAPCLTSSGRGVERTGETRGQDPVVACVTGDVSHTLRAEGFDASEDGTGRGTPIICMAHGQGGAEIRHDSCPTLTCNHEAPIAAYAIQAGALRTSPQSGPDGIGVQSDIAYTIEARAEVQAVAAYAFQPRIGRNGRGDMGDLVNCLSARSGESGTGDSAPCVAVACGIHPLIENDRQVVAFSCKDYGADAAAELSPTLRAMGHAASHANAGGQVAVAIALQDTSGRDKVQNGKGWSDNGASYTLDAAATQGVAYAFAQNTRDEVRMMGGDGQIVGALAAQPGMKQTCYVAQCVAFEPRYYTRDNKTGGAPSETVMLMRDCKTGDSTPHVATGMQVRRLTPMECERLQGFPDNYTLVPVRGKPAADGPRYKACGNSMAVPVMRWLGRRIQMSLNTIPTC
jgi:DNA (cytosine-5)-methyltransferase 1